VGRQERPFLPPPVSPQVSKTIERRLDLSA
jgi:hypothetical protein